MQCQINGRDNKEGITSVTGRDRGCGVIKESDMVVGSRGGSVGQSPELTTQKELLRRLRCKMVMC